MVIEKIDYYKDILRENQVLRRRLQAAEELLSTHQKSQLEDTESRQKEQILHDSQEQAQSKLNENLLAMNEMLIVGALRQNELTEVAENLNDQLSSEIVQRKKVEERLRESEQRLRAIYNGTHEYIGLLSPDGTLLEANKASLAFAGSKREEVVGLLFWETVWFQYTPGAPEAMHNAVKRAAAGEFVRFEAPIINPSGEEMTFDISLCPIKNEKGEVTHIVPEGRDVTERKKTEAALHDSDTRFQAMADAIPQLAWTAHRDGFIHWYNSRWYEYTGTTAEDMEGWGWQSVHDPEVLPKVLEGWKASIATGEPFEMIFPLRGVDEKFRNFLTRVQPLKDDEGRITQWFGTNTDVEEIQRAEVALRESEERFRSTFENAAIGIAHVGLDGKWLRMNQETCRITGYTVEELEKMNFADITHPDDIEADLTQVRRVLAGEIGTFSIEKRYIRKDGSPVWVQLTVSLLRDAQAQPVHFISAIADITAKKTALGELEEQRRFIERVTEVLPNVLYVYSLPESRTTWVNRQVHTLIGYSEKEIIELGAEIRAMALHPDDMERVKERFDKLAVLAKDEVYNFEYRVRHRNGNWLWIQSRESSFTRDEEGCITDIIGTATDITERKHAEEALLQSERRFREMVDALPAAIFTTDAEGVLTHFNPATIEYSGRMPKLGSDQWCKDWKLFRSDGSPLPHRECPMTLALREGSVIQNDEVISVRPDGSRIWFIPYPSPLRDTSGKIVGGINMLVDITERKKAEEALHQAQEVNFELMKTKLLQQGERAILEERNRMAQDIHDTLAQGFTGILIQLEAAKFALEQSQVQLHVSQARELARESLQEARRAVRAMRPKALEGEQLPGALARLMQHVSSTIAMKAKLEVHGAPYKLPLDVEDHLYRIGQEALTNAIRYSEATEILMELTFDPTQVRLSIQDNGQGFEVHSRIQEEGMGLIGMYERTEHIGGQMTLESRPGQGTFITVTKTMTREKMGASLP